MRSKVSQTPEKLMPLERWALGDPVGREDHWVTSTLTSEVDEEGPQADRDSRARTGKPTSSPTCIA